MYHRIWQSSKTLTGSIISLKFGDEKNWIADLFIEDNFMNAALSIQVKEKIIEPSTDASLI